MTPEAAHRESEFSQRINAAAERFEGAHLTNDEPTTEAGKRLAAELSTSRSWTDAGPAPTRIMDRSRQIAAIEREAAHRDTREQEAYNAGRLAGFEDGIALHEPIASRDGEVAAALDVERLDEAIGIVSERADNTNGLHVTQSDAEAIAAEYARLAAPSAPSSGDLDAASDG